MNDILAVDKINAKVMSHIRDHVYPTVQSLSTHPYLSKGQFLADVWREATQNWPDNIKMILTIEYKEPGLHVAFP